MRWLVPFKTCIICRWRICFSFFQLFFVFSPFFRKKTHRIGDLELSSSFHPAPEGGYQHSSKLWSQIDGSSRGDGGGVHSCGRFTSSRVIFVEMFCLWLFEPQRDLSKKLPKNMYINIGYMIHLGFRKSSGKKASKKYLEMNGRVQVAKTKAVLTFCTTTSPFAKLEVSPWRKMQVPRRCSWLEWDTVPIQVLGSAKCRVLCSIPLFKDISSVAEKYSCMTFFV